jgi:glycerol-3-phosphate dehydrogenase subunit C
MPKLELGDLERWTRTRTPTSRCWRSMPARAGPSSRAVPSCTLMFKQELPLMFPDDADVQLVKAAMFDPFEYLVRATRTAC